MLERRLTFNGLPANGRKVPSPVLTIPLLTMNVWRLLKISSERWNGGHVGDFWRIC